MNQRKIWYFLVIGFFFYGLASCGTTVEEGEDVVETDWVLLSELGVLFEDNKDKVASRLEGRYEDEGNTYKVQFYTDTVQRSLAYTDLTNAEFVALGTSLNTIGLELSFYSVITSDPDEQINAIWNIAPTNSITVRSTLNPVCYGSSTEGFQLISVATVAEC